MSENDKANVSAEQVIAAFVKLRDLRSTLKADYEAEDAILKGKQEKLQKWLLKQMSDLGMTQIGATGGTAYRELDTKFSASDWTLVWQYIKENDRFDLLQKRLGEGALKEILNETGELPPGISMFQEYKVNIRRK